MDLHQAIFENNWHAFEEAISVCKDIDEVDNHGHTALHLAVILNRKEMIDVLLEKNAQCWTTSKGGWTPIDDAIALRCQPSLEKLLKRRQDEWKDSMDERVRPILELLGNQLADFYMEIRWDFRSWIPFVSSFCPSDTCRIWKMGRRLRLDSGIVGLENGTWIHGNMSILAELAVDGPIIQVVDHDKKMKQQIFPFKNADASIKMTAKTYLNLPIVQSSLQADDCSISPLISVADKVSSYILKGKKREKSKMEKVGDYMARPFNVENVNIHTRLRTEHLSPSRCRELELDKWLSWDEAATAAETENKKELKKWIRRLSDASESSWSNSNCDEEVDIDGTGLDPHVEPKCCFAEYRDSKTFIHPGKKMHLSKTNRNIRASVWMAPTKESSKYPAFPLTVNQFTTLLETFEWGQDGCSGNSSSRPLHQLRQFLTTTLPKGFPVRIEIPVWGSAVYANIMVGGYRRFFPGVENFPWPEICFSNLESYSSTNEIYDAVWAVPDEYENGVVFEFLS